MQKGPKSCILSPCLARPVDIKGLMVPYLKAGPAPRLDISRRQRIARAPVSPLQLDIAVREIVRFLNLYSVAR